MGGGRHDPAVPFSWEKTTLPVEMPLPDAEVEQLLATADAAAARGDRRAALLALDRVLALDGSRADVWMRLASMRRAGGDAAGALVAVERALAIRPLDFVALLLRAHLLEQAGDPAAGEVYGYALAQAPDDMAGQAPAIVRMLARAREANERFIADRHRALEEAMAPAERVAEAGACARLARFRDNVLKRTHVYHSDPTDYHFPGLVEREFHDRVDFPWLADLEAATDAIRGELLALLGGEGAERVPYVQYAAHLPMAQWVGLNHSLDWTALHLLARGKRVEANASRCPATLAALSRLPQPDIAGYGPNAMFSLLKPGAHIPPHVGVANTRLVCHLPLVVPPGCWFRVGADRRAWREGEAFVFDDTIEHEAANKSDAPRVVLIADVWHPGLDDAERQGVAALMAAGGRTGRVTGDML